MRVAVCDDIKEAIIDLREKLEELSDIERIDEFDSLEALTDTITTGAVYDIVFMDIDWKGESVNGIEFAEKLKRMPVVFVTAYPVEFAEKIFDKSFQPAGFLIKPAKLEQIKILIEKIKVNASKTQTTICLNVGGRQIVLNVSDIMYLENNLHKTIIHTQNHEKIVVGKNLASIKESLPQDFIECHKSYIVNPDFVAEAASKEFVLKNGSRVPVSRAHSESARVKFMEYMY